MNDEYLEKWLIKASHDLKAARHESTNTKDEVLTDIVCFHSQQAAEKYLKAFLVWAKIEFSRSHSLEYLIQLCKQKEPGFESLETGNLSQYAVEIRYAESFEMPSREEAEETLRIAENIRVFVLNKIGIAPDNNH